MATVASPEVTTAEVTPGPLSPSRLRIDSVDMLRGIVMVIMLLDHTRDFVHSDAIRFDPSNLNRTTVLLFFTRWITHYCAPIFVFLAGTGAFLQLARGKSKPELSKFLVTRGLWLILLEFTIVRFGYTFNLHYLSDAGLLQVIWVIGLSMIILAALIYLPIWAIASFGIAMIAFHNLLDPFAVPFWTGPPALPPSGLKALWMVLHSPGPFPPFGLPGPVLFVAYPLIPWVGVMAAGYAFGAVYKMEPERRRRILIGMGLAATALFIVIRAINIYGDPLRWSHQKNAIFTVMSFLNVQKYPPSLLYLLMTLGPAMVALALFERETRGRIGRFFVTFGRVPLFFYILQWYFAHGIAILMGLAAGQPVSYQWAPFFEKFKAPEGVGFGLLATYIAWIAGVLLLYPLCKWFAGVKQRRKDWWLSYL
jgi:uncharacterized membrane protein